MIPKLDEICTCCGGYENQPVLQLFEDKCFRIADGKETKGDFCIGDFAFPVDGYTCVGLNVEVDGGELVIFDNGLEAFSPLSELDSGKEYARGVLIRIFYPIKNKNGEDLNYSEKTVKVQLQNAIDFSFSEFPIHDLLTIFTNAKSNNPQDLINKLKIINTNKDFSIRVSGLVLFGKAE
jgi:hypothetical protein